VSGFRCQDYESDDDENHQIPQSVISLLIRLRRNTRTLTPSPILLLELTEAIVESLPVHQLGMAAGFDDVTPVEDDDPIDVAHRR